MRITIDKKLYHKPVNISIKSNILLKICPWALVFGMFVGLAVLMLKCF